MIYKVKQKWDSMPEPKKKKYLNFYSVELPITILVNSLIN